MFGQGLALSQEIQDMHETLLFLHLVEMKIDGDTCLEFY